MDKMARSLRRSCLQKIDISEDKVEGMRRGEFPEDPNLKCYTNCIMKLIRTFKNGNIDFAMVIKQVELSMAPEEAAVMKEAILKCSHMEYTGDECQKSYTFVKCTYDTNPEKFFFP
ncbi:odorant binding protein 5 isoform X2 [Bombus vancouverensis nearcticus]